MSDYSSVSSSGRILLIRFVTMVVVTVVVVTVEVAFEIWETKLVIISGIRKFIDLHRPTLLPLQPWNHRLSAQCLYDRHSELLSCDIAHIWDWMKLQPPRALADFRGRESRSDTRPLNKLLLRRSNTAPSRCHKSRSAHVQLWRWERVRSEERRVGKECLE